METQFETQQQFHLADAQNYKKGQVEFRTIMSSHNGSVDLVAFDAGSHLPVHEAPEDVLVYVLEGEVDFAIKEKTERLNAGDAMLLSKGTRHEVHPLRDSKVMLIKIRP